MSLAAEILKDEKKLQKEVEALNTEIKSFESKIEELNAELNNKLGQLKLVTSYRQKLQPSQVQQSFQLQPGTELAKIRDLIKKTGKPMYIEDIMLALGLDPKDRNKRSSLGGSLNTYSKVNRVFKKTDPNTFSLIDMKTEHNKEDSKNDELHLKAL